MDNQGVKYYDRNATPLRFHKFYIFVRCPLTILAAIGNIAKLQLGGANGTYSTIQIILHFAIIALILAFFVTSSGWYPSAWKIVMFLECLFVLPTLISDAYAFYYLGSNGIRITEEIMHSFYRDLGSVFVEILIIVYYFKRKNLFNGTQAETAKQTVSIQKTIEVGGNTDKEPELKETNTIEAKEDQKNEFIEKTVDEQEKNSIDSIPDLYDDVVAETKNKNEYWRNENGVISCPGDDCPKENCDDTCPIWNNTTAGSLFAIGNPEKALAELDKAVKTAPDFKDAWVNMGACYGSRGQYQKALEAYQKAYDIDNEYKNAIFGLALCNRDLGNYEESLKWCRLYRSKFSDNALDSTEKEVSNRIQKETLPKSDGSPDRSFNMQYGAAFSLLLDDSTYDKGLSRIIKLEEEGFAEAGVLLGQIFRNDPNEAVRHFKIAANKNIAEGCWGLQGYVEHNHVPQNGNKNDEYWVSLVKKAAELGCPEAMNEMGNIENRRGNYFLSAYWYGLSDIYEYPQAVYGCRGIASRWVDAGRPEIPEEHIGDPYYEQGRLLIDTDTDNRETALNNILNSAEKDNYPAIKVFAAKVYEVKGEDEKAFKLYKEASALGDIYASRACADMLMIGKGCEKNFKKAVISYANAAKRGDKNSCFVMGEIERNRGNKNLAKTWYVKAHVRGMEHAIERIRQMKDDEQKEKNKEINKMQEDKKPSSSISMEASQEKTANNDSVGNTGIIGQTVAASDEAANKTEKADHPGIVETEPKQNTSNIKTVEFCRFCGAKVYPYSKFCNRCGKRL